MGMGSVTHPLTGTEGQVAQSCIRTRQQER